VLADTSSRPFVSVVIPVRDDAEGLRRCLKSVEGAHHATRVEIVVVDNGSRDDSAAVAREAGAVVIAAPGERVSAARNLGAAAASGDLLAFVDADHVIAADWLQQVITRLQADPRAAAFGAPYLSPPGAGLVQRAYDLLRSHASVAGEVEWLGTGNLVVKRDLFSRIGGFDSTLETCEDVDFCRRVRASGHRLVSDPALRSVHYGDPDSLRAVFAGELWRGRDNVRVSFRRPRSFRSLLSLGTSAVVLLGLVAFGAGVILIPFAGAATAVVGITLVGLGVTARLVRMLGNARQGLSPALAVTAFAVAAAYEAGRAIALVVPTGHSRRRQSARRGRRA
jgi:GT2 family glycosyltransferase